MHNRRLLLIGGGHSNIEVLRQLAVERDASIAITLVSPEPLTAYSGMLPGLVAGHYSVEDSHIRLAPLCAAAGAQFVLARAVALDPHAPQIELDSGGRIDFDVAAMDVGSVPDMTIPGSDRYTISVKPVASFLKALDTIIDDVQRHRVSSIAVVGGGAGGTELVLAMQHRLQNAATSASFRLALISDRLNVASAVRRRLTALFARRCIDLHLGSPVRSVEAGRLLLQSGEIIAAQRIVWATSASPAPWLAASGVACDANGFIRINNFLQSPSHACIFAAGDCASQDGKPRPKSGVFAVREGRPLAQNLRRFVHGQPLVRFNPQRATLALISTGGREAIAAYGPFAIQGPWVWRWKDRIDREFVARYRT